MSAAAVDNGNQTTGTNSTTKKKTKKKIPGVHQGWYSETESMWPGHKLSLALEEFSDDSVLYSADSEYQSILVFRSAQYGNVLVLDGVIQMTEYDFYSYHEMITHIPICSHIKSSKKHILIVGGGDGGILREVSRYSINEIESITLIEIDPMVIEVVQKYFKDTLRWDDPRLRIIHADAAQYLRNQTNNSSSSTTTKPNECYDIIYVDTSDPIGPAQTLYQPEFYDTMYQCLNPGGMICVQAECYWIHLDLISDLISCCRSIFHFAHYASTNVPTYPCGQIGFIIAGKEQEAKQEHTTTCMRPLRTPEFISELKYYSPQMHCAAFVLPKYIEDRLDQRNVLSTANMNNFISPDDDDDDDGEKCILQGCNIQ